MAKATTSHSFSKKGGSSSSSSKKKKVAAITTTKSSMKNSSKQRRKVWQDYDIDNDIDNDNGSKMSSSSPKKKNKNKKKAKLKKDKKKNKTNNNDTTTTNSSNGNKKKSVKRKLSLNGDKDASALALSQKRAATAINNKKKRQQQQGKKRARGEMTHFLGGSDHQDNDGNSKNNNGGSREARQAKFLKRGKSASNLSRRSSFGSDSSYGGGGATPISFHRLPILLDETPWFGAHSARGEEKHGDGTNDDAATTNNHETTAPQEKGVTLPLPQQQKKQQTHECLSPLDEVDTNVSTFLSNLHQELLDFCANVRLTPQECRARQCAISLIHNCTGELFRTGVSASRSDNGSDSDNVWVEPFGSFATPQVCTFNSDVDVCVWGAVPAPSHTRTFAMAATTDDNIETPVQAEKVKRKQKWHEALAEMDQLQQQQEKEEGKKKVSPKQKGAIISNNAATLNNNTDAMTADMTSNNKSSSGEISTGEGDKGEQEAETQPLFVIDRVPVLPEIADSKTTATATPAYSEQKIDLKQTESLAAPQSKSQKKKEKKQEFSFLVDGDGAKELGHERDDSNDRKKKDGIQANCGVIDLTSETSNNDAIPNAAEEKGGGEGLKAQAAESTVADVDSTGRDGDDSEIEVWSPTREKNAKEQSSDSEDDADKMESFAKSDAAAHGSAVDSPAFHTRSHSPPPQPKPPAQRQQDRESEEDHYVIGLSSSTTNSDEGEDSDFADEDNDNDDGFEVSCFASKPPPPPAAAAIVGPTGHTRKLVISALQKLGRRLRASAMIGSLHVRQHARVPIIAMTTTLGFEADVALGGHNGTDTSRYATAQVGRFQSFAPVVLLLKMLLQQNDLDKPFTGGLGSYKLYVLVAHHLEKHLASGGSDEPAEVLIGFLYRYGLCRQKGLRRHSDSASVTDLSTTEYISSDGGTADMKPVYKVEQCVDLFTLCYEQLLSSHVDNDGKKESLLSCLIDTQRYQEERRKSLRRAAYYQQHQSSLHRSSTDARRSKSTKNVFTFRNSISTGGEEEGSRRRPQAAVLHGRKRGPRGNLEPLSRPDMEAKRRRRDPVAELFSRGTKNRKNKKKQTRDKGMKQAAQFVLESYKV